MNHLNALIKILTISFILAIIGFLIDLGERVPNIWINIFEVFVMTGVIFIIITAIYLAVLTLNTLVQKIKMYKQN